MSKREGNHAPRPCRVDQALLHRVRRRKTTAERKAEAARKAEMLKDVDASAPFSLQQRQPWSSKVAEVRDGGRAGQEGRGPGQGDGMPCCSHR